MICPKCSKDTWKVKSSYRLKEYGLIVRNRECKNCKYKIKTIEIPKDDYESMKQLIKDFRDTTNNFLKHKPRYM